MTSKDSIPDVGANGSCVFMAAFQLLSSSAPVSSTAGASSAAVSMQLSSARVGGLAPARETVTAAALSACVRSWQGGPLYLVCHWDSLSKRWNFGLLAQNSGDRAHLASRKSTTTHNWTQELAACHSDASSSLGLHATRAPSGSSATTTTPRSYGRELEGLEAEPDYQAAPPAGIPMLGVN